MKSRRRNVDLLAASWAKFAFKDSQQGRINLLTHKGQAKHSGGLSHQLSAGKFYSSCSSKSVGPYLDNFFGVHLCAFPNCNPTSPPHLIFLCVLLESSASCKPLCLPRPRPPTPDFPWWCNQCSHLLLFITHHQETIFGRSQNSPTSFTSYR